MTVRAIEIGQRAVVIPSPVVVERERPARVQLSILLKEATQNVRPSNRMVSFYNAVGRLPLRLGTSLLVLTSLDAIKVVWRAGVQKRTDSALQILYSYRPRLWRGPWALGDALWQSSYNCRSVRARGQFVQGAVRFLLGHLAWERASRDGEERLNVVSLGSGSASQLLWGAADNGFDANDIEVVLVDHDPRALKAAQENAHRLGLEVAVKCQETTIGRFLRTAVPGSLDLVEMVGLTDYFKDHQVRRYLRGIRAALAPGGLFLGSNISSRKEAAYAHGAACWPRMYYRSEEELRQLLREAGFGRIWTGECGLYTVLVAQKGFHKPLSGELKTGVFHFRNLYYNLLIVFML